MVTLFRGCIVHTPRNPFKEPEALEAFADGGLVVDAGRVVALGDYSDVRESFPDARTVDCRPGLILPGLVDLHVHWPQVHVIGAMGLELLPWLQKVTLPEEVRLADPQRARQVARRFLAALRANGVTTSLVFGSHFPQAQDIFFSEAEASGLRIISGMVLSDRGLLAPLHQTPREAYEASMRLIHRWHGRGRLRYAVTPRFALSASEAMLEVARELLEAAPGLYFQTHLNENLDEIAAVKALFPQYADYLGVYEAFQLLGPRSIFAHNVHPTDDELRRLAATRSAVAHCPCSNSFLASGLFPLRRHLEFGVTFGLGTDVGAGTGFGILKEAMMAYQVQRLHPQGFSLKAAHLLYLATRAGAEALGLQEEIGDLLPGKQADFLWLRPPEGSTLEALLEASPSLEASLGAVFALAGEESIAAVYVGGERLGTPRPEGEGP